MSDQPPHQPDWSSGPAGVPPPPPQAPGGEPYQPYPPYEPVGPDEGFLETCVSVLTRPVPTLRRLTARPQTAWAIWLTVGLSILSAIGSLPGFRTPTPPGAAEPFATPGFGAGLAAGAVILAPAFGLGFLAVWVAILHGLARLLGGSGSYRGLFSGAAFANVPSVLAVPFQLLPLAIGVAGAALASLVSFGTFVWTVVLDVIAVRESHHLSTGRAVAAVLIPIAVLLVLAVILAVVFVALVLSAFG